MMDRKTHYELHGLLMCIAWLVVAPISALTARWASRRGAVQSSSQNSSPRILLVMLIHKIGMATTIVLTLVGTYLALTAGDENNDNASVAAIENVGAVGNSEAAGNGHTTATGSTGSADNEGIARYGGAENSSGNGGGGLFHVIFGYVIVILSLIQPGLWLSWNCTSIFVRNFDKQVKDYRSPHESQMTMDTSIADRNEKRSRNGAANDQSLSASDSNISTSDINLSASDRNVSTSNKEAVRFAHRIIGMSLMLLGTVINCTLGASAFGSIYGKHYAEIGDGSGISFVTLAPVFWFFFALVAYSRGGCEKNDTDPSESTTENKKHNGSRTGELDGSSATPKIQEQSGVEDPQIVGA